MTNYLEKSIKAISNLFGWVIAFFFITGTSLAEEASKQSFDWGSAQLIANKDPSSGELAGLVEIRLNKGWKTYWRAPGNSGIPPEFDFSRSKDSVIGEVKFPIPELITAGGSSFYGYKDDVVRFPFTGSSFGSQGDLRLDLLIGVCEEICIPAMTSLSIDSATLDQSNPQGIIGYERAKALLPPMADDTQKVEISVDDEANLSIPGAVGDQVKRVAVIFVPRVFTSDPVRLEAVGDQEMRAKFKLPQSLIATLKDLKEWQYTILFSNKEDNKIVRAVEGKARQTTKEL